MTLESFLSQTLPSPNILNNAPRDLLMTTLVGLKEERTRNAPLHIHDAPKCPTFKNGTNSLCHHQSIIWAAVRTLSNRSKSSSPPNSSNHRVSNMLTKGCQPSGRWLQQTDVVNTLSSDSWVHLQQTIGPEALLDLLLNTSIFVGVHVDGVKFPASSYFQLTGQPISDGSLQTGIQTEKSHIQTKKSHIRTLGQIKFERSRIFYALPLTNSNGDVVFGLPHTHVLNHSNPKLLESIFPRQFNLPNVFTSPGDRRSKLPRRRSKLPRRLSQIRPLVEQLQVLHKNCYYAQILKHYCPDNQIPGVTGVLDGASTTHQVGNFVCRVMTKVIPPQFWGGNTNYKLLKDYVKGFVGRKRYETYSLHFIMQNLVLTEFQWLSPEWIKSKKLSTTDASKRWELLAEFLFWLIHSFVIPLLRSHFYVTESTMDRTTLVYFRHDLWKKSTDRQLNILQTDMFKEFPEDLANKIFASRGFGPAKMRLLPKPTPMGTDYRIIMNCGYRTKFKPINPALKDLHNVLSAVGKCHPEKLGSSISSVGDIYARLKPFQTRLRQTGKMGSKLYFAKVDIKSCFDTIDQVSLMRIVKHLLDKPKYRIKKYGTVRPPLNPQRPPTRRFMSYAQDANNPQGVLALARLNAQQRRLRPSTVFVDDVVAQTRDTQTLLALLKSHVHYNIVKIGGKYYRQTKGIPQGSVVSSLLCNLFYGHLESKKMPFLFNEDGILLRFIDDFLYITLDRKSAQSFLESMLEGHPEYGAFVSPAKTLVNFDITVGGMKINRTKDTDLFPYCGLLLNTSNLNISKDMPMSALTGRDYIPTIDYCQKPQLKLYQKAQQAFKMHYHAMFFDTKFNNCTTVFQNLYTWHIHTAMYLHCGAVALRGSPNHLHPPQVLDFVKAILPQPYHMIQQRKSTGDLECSVTKIQARRLGAHAFRRVFKRVQTGYDDLLRWLDDELVQTAGYSCHAVEEVLKSQMCL